MAVKRSKHADLVDVFARFLGLAPLVGVVAFVASSNYWIGFSLFILLHYAYRQGYIDRHIRELEELRGASARRTDLGGQGETDGTDVGRDEGGPES